MAPRAPKGPTKTFNVRLGRVRQAITDAPPRAGPTRPLEPNTTYFNDDESTKIVKILSFNAITAARLDHLKGQVLHTATMLGAGAGLLAIGLAAVDGQQPRRVAGQIWNIRPIVTLPPTFQLDEAQEPFPVSLADGLTGHFSPSERETQRQIYLACAEGPDAPNPRNGFMQRMVTEHIGPSVLHNHDGNLLADYTAIWDKEGGRTYSGLCNARAATAAVNAWQFGRSHVAITLNKLLPALKDDLLPDLPGLLLARTKAFFLSPRHVAQLDWDVDHPVFTAETLAEKTIWLEHLRPVHVLLRYILLSTHPFVVDLVAMIGANAFPSVSSIYRDRRFGTWERVMRAGAGKPLCDRAYLLFVWASMRMQQMDAKVIKVCPLHKKFKKSMVKYDAATFFALVVQPALRPLPMPNGRVLPAIDSLKFQIPREVSTGGYRA